MTQPVGIPVAWYEKKKQQLDEANAAIQRIRDLHFPDEMNWCETCDSAEYPCLTIRALEGGDTSYGR